MNRSRLFVSLGTLVAATVVLLALWDSGQVARAQAFSWKLLVGGGEQGVSVNLFGPPSVRVHVGDTVTWTNAFSEAHSVTFNTGAPQLDLDPLIPLPPDNQLGANSVVFFPSFPGATPPYTGTGFFHSGLLNQGQAFSMTFATAGTFPYFCVLHPGMTGQVIVEDPGTTLPTQDDVDQQAKVVRDAETTAGLAALQEASVVQRDKLPGPASRWTVRMGGELPNSSLLAFMPGALRIQVGDTIEFAKTPGAPHNALYVPDKQYPPLLVAEPQPGGPPRLLLNNAVLAPSQPSGGTFDGSKLTNSGALGAPGASSYALTFTEPGTYEFICSFHQDVPMRFQVTVTERQRYLPFLGK
jgi:plastocyanin